MSRRDQWTLEQRERERTATRERMARLRLDPAYRDQANARRREQEAKRKAADPALIVHRRATKKRHYDKRHGDPQFEAERVERHKRWRHARRANEQAEAFIAAAEGEGV